MKVAFTTAGAIVPAVLLLRYFYRRDLNPEPRGVLIKTFLLGVLIVVPVILVELPLQEWCPPGAPPVYFGLYYAFLCAAVPEEFFKFLVVTRYSARNPAFDEPMDGVVYGAAASLGFAALENMMYVAGGGWPTAILRAFTAVPMHACLGAILGYYVGQVRFGFRRRAYLWWGLLAAVLLHGLYDLPLFVMQSTLAHSWWYRSSGAILAVMAGGYVGCLLVLAFAAIWVRRIVRQLQHEQVQHSVGSS